MVSGMKHVVEAVAGRKGGSVPGEMKDESGGRAGKLGLRVQYVTV